jgi:hypothetical protein
MRIERKAHYNLTMNYYYNLGLFEYNLEATSNYHTTFMP